MVRFYAPNLDEACDALDLYDIDYDLDDGDRIMVDDSLYDDALVLGCHNIALSYLLWLNHGTFLPLMYSTSRAVMM